MIAGGEWQTALVRKIKEMGHEVINSNLYEDSPAFAFADVCEVADVRDKQKNLEIARRYGVQAVLTDESDIAVTTVAYVAEQLGLPGIGQEKASLFTNKFQMRCFLREQGFPIYPEFALCHRPKEAAAFAEHLGCRTIMKPLDSQSSRAVYIIDSARDIHHHFRETAESSSDRYSVLIERYIEGTEFTVDGIMVGGHHHTLAISEKKHYPYNPNIASELFFSYDNPRFDYDQLRKLNDRLVELAGLPFGLTHVEYKYENGQFYLIEAAARGGGTRISSDIVPLLTGIDTYQYLIWEALGEKEKLQDFRAPRPYGRCAVLKFLDIEDDGRVVKEIRGEQEIRENPQVLELHLEFAPGDRVYRANDDRSRVGFYIASAGSREELLKLMEWIGQTLQIVYDE